MSFPRKSETKSIVGALIWIAAIGSLAIFLRSSLKGDQVFAKLKSYFGKQSRTVELYSNEYQRIGIGDPIFLQANGETVRVGNVAFIDFGEGYEEYKIGDTHTAQVTLYGNAPAFEPGDYFEVHQSSQSMEWIIRTMMPAETRQRIGQLITQAWTEKQEDLIALFKPIIEDSISDASRIIREDLQVAIDNHQEEIDKLSARYQEQLIQKEILPLVRNEIWPIVQEEARPLTEQIGREIWKEVSVWRFGWRYIYDNSPLPEKKLTEKEFNRFVEKSAVPILENHLEDFIAVQEALISRISSNEKVKETVSRSIREVANDAEFRALVTSIFREVLIENERLKQSLNSTWKSPRAQLAMDRANRSLDPVVTEIGATLFGSTRTAITPQFARVLRSKVLHKDARWLTLHTKAAGNRDEALAKQIIESADKVETQKSRKQMLMFQNWDNEDYPVSAAPPVSEVVDRRIKEAKKVEEQ
jgi:hypothetical protein